MTEVSQRVKESVRQEVGLCKCGSMEEVEERLRNGSCWIYHTHTFPLRYPGETRLGIKERNGTCKCDRANEDKFNPP